MDIGYARVSTGEQTLALQLDALAQAGCGKVFTETASGATADRPALGQALAYLREGDTLVVWRLDRLGRSLPHLIETVAALRERGVGFRSLTEQVDTTTPGGKLVFHVFGALAEFERDLIRERTHAGLAAARARGRTGGRPRSWPTPSASPWRGPSTRGGRPTSPPSAAPWASPAPPSTAPSDHAGLPTKLRPRHRGSQAPPIPRARFGPWRGAAAPGRAPL
jgi:DNA invertase Pin-like site-specific DNA recombinase